MKDTIDDRLIKRLTEPFNDSYSLSSLRRRELSLEVTMSDFNLISMSMRFNMSKVIAFNYNHVIENSDKI